MWQTFTNCAHFSAYKPCSYPPRSAPKGTPEYLRKYTTLLKGFIWNTGSTLLKLRWNKKHLYQFWGGEALKVTTLCKGLYHHATRRNPSTGIQTIWGRKSKTWPKTQGLHRSCNFSGIFIMKVTKQHFIKFSINKIHEVTNPNKD